MDRDLIVVFAPLVFVLVAIMTLTLILCALGVN